MSMTRTEEKAPDLDTHLPLPVEEVKLRLESLNEQVTSFIKEHTGLCLVGAVALGYIVARVARKVT
jgi:hypothetical protein